MLEINTYEKTRGDVSILEAILRRNGFEQIEEKVFIRRNTSILIDKFEEGVVKAEIVGIEDTLINTNLKHTVGYLYLKGLIS